MSVVAAAGFRAAGVTAGIKASGGRDVALVVNDGPSDVAAAVFTRNRVKAAPVLWSQQAVADGRVKAVVLNSGGANACTGPDGFADTHRTAEHVAAVLGCGAGDVLVCSTGLIGERLPLQKVLAGAAQAAAGLRPDADAGAEAADAIRTTDSVSKQAAVTHDDGWTVGGMAKGAGMLAPSLATMLCVITTDAVLDTATADAALREAVDVTFERVDSDGATSTNDTVVLLASGASGVTPDPQVFTALLTEVAQDLALQLVADAEGATKEVTVDVVSAASVADAVEVGRAIARDNLVKTALFGSDPNWGRIIAAVGVTSAAFEPDEIDVAVNGVVVCRGGAAGEPRDLVDMTPRAIAITVDLHAGVHTATIWTNDLSHGYVHENSAYSS
ncbi:bifunctional glutamate N-acetyltransferase/amino-acid acetyltransferase ArgJ [Jatrophihabitans sp. YIM 134969]